MDECRAENCKAKHPHQRFCPQGHDTFECGRRDRSTCRACARKTNAHYNASEQGLESSRRYYASLPPLKKQRKVIREARRRISIRRAQTSEVIKEIANELLADD